MKKQTDAVSHPERYREARQEGPVLVTAATDKNEVHFLSMSGATLKLYRAARTLIVFARVVALASRTHPDAIIPLLDVGIAIRIPN